MARSFLINEPGLFRISRRSCELYSVQILSAGTWGRIRIEDGDGNGIWAQPSTFTGSFWLGAAALNGLVVDVSSSDFPNVTINYRERDSQVV